MNIALQTAQSAQRAASDPEVSAFVAASAGSGKTKLLTDRLLRLMLAGTDPGRILCLTFTRAAAAEMAIRLRGALGRWVTLDDAALDEELAALAVPRNAKTRERARALFAMILDLPGGMRIGTIHAFCQSLLRRFPLEAGISPYFALEDDMGAAQRRREAREAAIAAAEAASAIGTLAAEQNETQFASLAAALLTDPEALGGLLAQHGREGLAALQRASLGASDHDEAELWRIAVTGLDEAALAEALRRIAREGTESAGRHAGAALDWLARDAAGRIASWGVWLGVFLTKDGGPRTAKNFVNKKLMEAAPGLFDVIAAEQERILSLKELLANAALLKLSQAMISLAAPMLEAEGTHKINKSRLDYADLIIRTAQLLIDPGAAWVLYKLDGGIDHILLDEVQDIAPAQWRIIGAIADEFFSGEAARGASRTIFAVGDAKQSIYSFQGADLASFTEWRDRLRRRVVDAGARWHDGALETSFRSTAPVLALADAVFDDDEAGIGVRDPGEALHHRVNRTGQAGSVSLWPLAPNETDPDMPEWDVPEDYHLRSSARRRLARGLAQWIAGAVGSFPLPSRDRALAPGDVLILVRSRNELGPALVRALKEAGVPVAGLDRMVLTESRAVADIIALAEALLLPSDDLAMATYLASPLGGLDDASLMELALERRGSLAQALFARGDERAEWRAARDMFATLQARVDYATPYRLFSELLGPLNGRAKLLARLGPEAAEPIDELLAAALDYQSREAGTLQGFLAALASAAAEVRREAEAAGDVVRIMTVHGAKGLQAPLVILPETTSLPNPIETLFWLPVPQSGATVPILCPRASARSAAITRAVEEGKAAQAAEHNRLLYVALTRAEDHLIVCGAESRKRMSESCWYASVQRGFSRLEDVVCMESDLPWPGEIRSLSCVQAAPPDRVARIAEAGKVALPAWLGAPPLWRAAAPAPESTSPERLAPSRSAEGEARGLAAASPRQQSARAATLARGQLIHALLQHLPDLPETERLPAARRHLAQPGHGLDEAARKSILRDIAEVLGHPDLAALFGPDSRAEAPIAGVVAGIEIGGLIDRLLVTPERILIADYKTDRAPPADAEAIPVPYLAQLAAYAALLRSIHPEREIAAVIVWTADARVMPVPAELLARHAPRSMR
ncbi:MAG TPA: double-strand break repair helicase AddA [Acetobacteraceae bacterium]|nr:double-strand break repair helicase AddA [Acetobacteraceae bacterium]